MGIWDNWTKKLSVIIIAVWALTIVWRTIVLKEAIGLIDIATSGVLILAAIGGKSALSAYISGKGNGNGNGNGNGAVAPAK